MHFAGPIRPVILAAMFALSGCSTDNQLERFNPVNWFGQNAGDAEPETPTEPKAIPSDGRQFVDRVTSVRLEPTRFGAILRVGGSMLNETDFQPVLRPSLGSSPDAQSAIRYDLVLDVAQTRSISLNRILFGQDRGDDSGPVEEPVNDGGEVTLEELLREEITVSAATFIDRDTLEAAQAIVVSSQSGSMTVNLR